MQQLDRTVLTGALGLGALAGMRGLSAPAVLSAALVRNGAGRSASWPLRLLSSRAGASLVSVLAAGEFVADKTPFVQDRVKPVPLAGRALMGAASGTMLALFRRRTFTVPALAGAASAVASAFAAYHVRRAAGRALHVPDAILGAAEDALVVALGWRLAALAGGGRKTRMFRLRR
jgi:uncharacterized membrane protein